MKNIVRAKGVSWDGQGLASVADTGINCSARVRKVRAKEDMRRGRVEWRSHLAVVASHMYREAISYYVTVQSTP